MTMALVAHKYMPQEMPEEELRATFAAREHTLDYLVKSLRGQCGSKTLTSYLITGPRGSGKTTIVLMLCLRIREDEKLSAAWLPVRFPEELPGITSLRDLLAAALHEMAEDGVPGAAEWHERVAGEMDDEQSRELAVSGLRQIAHEQNRRLVLFVENLDLVFHRGLDEPGQRTLRRLLMDGPFIMIVGTAVKMFEALRVYDEAFFNYFCPVPLDRLDDAQVAAVLFRRAEYDGNEEFDAQYERHKGRIKAISRLTGGNPRMVLMLYEALAHGNLASTVETLRALVDELTPLLKDVLEHQFSDQQSKILDALMRSGGTATPSQIARAARLSLNTVTTQLPRLKAMQVVEVRGGGKGRPAYYTVPDQLFCTWYQMRYLRPGRRRIEIFVEVLRVWFDEEERLRHVKRLAEQALASTGKTARDASLAATGHHAEAQELVVRTWLETGQLREAALALAEDSHIRVRDLSRYEAAAYVGLGRWSREHDDLDTEIRAIQAAIERSPGDLTLHLWLGLTLLSSGRYDTACHHLDYVAMSEASDMQRRAAAILARGACRGIQGDATGEAADYTAVVALEGAAPVFTAQALVCRGDCKQTQGDTDGAIADYTTVVALDGAPPLQRAQALVSRGDCKQTQGDTDGAIADYAAVVALEGAPAAERAKALLGRGDCKRTQGDMDGAITDYSAVLDLEGAPTEGVAHVLQDHGMSGGIQGESDDAIADYTVTVMVEAAPTSLLGLALFSRGVSKSMQGAPEGAIADYTAVLELSDTSGAAAARALVLRGISRLSVGETGRCLEDFLAAMMVFEAEKKVRTHALFLALLIASQIEDDTCIERVSRSTTDALAHLEPAERAQEIEGVLLRLALGGMESGWPRVWTCLREGQPPEVIERLEFFRPVAEILQTGDRSRLDPLPPEQRAFVEEVLEKFEADEAQQE